VATFFFSFATAAPVAANTIATPKTMSFIENALTLHNPK
jgi:hypothetical protein